MYAAFIKVLSFFSALFMLFLSPGGHIRQPLAAKKCAETENRSQLEDFIRGQIRRRVYAATDIKPVTMLHISYLE